MGGDIQGRLLPKDDKQKERMNKMGLDNPNKIFKINDLAKGDLMFAATGITRGKFLRGVRFIKGGAITESMVMRSKTLTLRFMTSVHRFDKKPKLIKDLMDC
jgi:fructose-1,6-bisphosphatase II